MRHALFLMMFTVGCSSSSLTESVAELEQRAASVNDCCEIDDRSLGREDHLVRLGSRVVLIHDWVKTDGEYTGFSMTVSEGKAMSYLIKLGSQTLSGNRTLYATDGRSIARINFCGECDSPDGCEDGGEGDPPGEGGGGDDDGGGSDPACPGGDCPTEGGTGPVLL